MKAKKERCSNRVASNELLERKIFSALSGCMHHAGTCHKENWGGYCDCGVAYAKKRIRVILRSNAAVHGRSGKD